MARCLKAWVLVEVFESLGLRVLGFRIPGVI